METKLDFTNEHILYVVNKAICKLYNSPDRVQLIDRAYTNDFKPVYKIIHKKKLKASFHAGERTIVFRLALYLNEIIESEFSKDKFVIDIEYNRKFYEPKKLKGHLIIPDLIIHQRISHENLLVVECKGWWDDNKEHIKDIEKLKHMTSNDYDFKYQLGLFIMFDKSKVETLNSLKWFSGGKEYNINPFDKSRNKPLRPPQQPPNE